MSVLVAAGLRSLALGAWLLGGACAATPARDLRPAPPARDDLFISQIAIHPLRPRTVFALTTYAIGLLKSTDGGERWSLANRGILSYSLYPLALDPRNPDIVYVGGGGGGLYKSTDGGGTFAEMNDGLGNTNLGSITLHPDDPDRVLVVTSSGVYISPDGGRSWIPWNEGDDFTQSQQFQDLVIVRTRPETVLLASNRGVFARRAGEPAWRLASEDLSGRPITAMALHPDGRRVYAAALRDGKTLAGGGLYASDDAGLTWMRWDRGLEREWIRGIRFDPRRPTVTYAAASTAGVLRSADGGRTWAAIGRGLEGQDVRTLAVDSTDPQRLYAGTHGRGVFGSVDGGATWTALDRVPELRPDAIIASLNVRPSSRSRSSLVPPPAFAKCNACHGWTDPDLNQAPHSFWLVPPNRRDWGPTLARMGPIAGLTPDEQEEVRRFLTAYSERGSGE